MTKLPYLKSPAATILWLIKLLTGIFALYSIFMIIKAAIPAIQLAGQASEAATKIGISDYMQAVVAEMGTSVDSVQQFIDSLPQISGSSIFFMVSILALIVYIAMSPILTILDAYGATRLRLRNRGTVLIKVIHMIDAAACLIVVVSSVVSMVMMIAAGKGLLEKSGLSKDGLQVLIIGFSIILFVVAIAFFVMFCYHKDIARVMSVIDDNICDFPTTMKKTRLSGLAIWFGVLCTLSLAGMIAGRENGQQAFPILTMISVGITALKYFCVAVCNRKVKKYNIAESGDVEN